MRISAHPLTDSLRRLIARLEALPDEARAVWGMAQGSIDDGGGYGDPHEDTRPDFIRQDEDGWQVIATYSDD
jgi:hypothetical protein